MPEIGTSIPAVVVTNHKEGKSAWQIAVANLPIPTKKGGE